MVSKLKKLESVMIQLSPTHQQSVIDYASYLHVQYPLESDGGQTLEPRTIERPVEESVVGAIKRLKQTYHMLDTDTLLNQVSALMGQHLLQGRDAKLVIDELENLFKTNYQKYRQQ